MHRIAEEGVAAHWKYKDGKPVSDDDDQRIAWMRQLIEWSQEMQEPGEFLSTLKVDLAPVEVYAFTPKGRVLELPRGRHSGGFRVCRTHRSRPSVRRRESERARWFRCATKSPTATWWKFSRRKATRPSRDWLSFVKSSHANSKIRHWINIQEREEATEMGRKLLENEVAQLRPQPEENSRSGYIEDWLPITGFPRLRILYAAVGFGKYSARQILTRVLGEPEKGMRKWKRRMPSRRWSRRSNACWGLAKLRLSSRATTICWCIARNVAIRFPATKSSGTSRAAGALRYTPARAPTCRIFFTRRSGASRWSGAARMRPLSRWSCRFARSDRAGLLADITAVISGAGSNIRNLVSRPDGLNARIDASLEIVDRRQLETILVNIRKIAAVHGVERVLQPG